MLEKTTKEEGLSYKTTCYQCEFDLLFAFNSAISTHCNNNNNRKQTRMKQSHTRSIFIHVSFIHISNLKCTQIGGLLFFNSLRISGLSFTPLFHHLLPLCLIFSSNLSGGFFFLGTSLCSDRLVDCCISSPLCLVSIVKGLSLNLLLLLLLQFQLTR